MQCVVTVSARHHTLQRLPSESPTCISVLLLCTLLLNPGHPSSQQRSTFASMGGGLPAMPERAQQTSDLAAEQQQQQRSYPSQLDDESVLLGTVGPQVG